MDDLSPTPSRRAPHGSLDRERETAGPYHSGERAVQEQAGVAEAARRIARSIRREIPHRAVGFLSELTTLVIGTIDGDGQPWATRLTLNVQQAYANCRKYISTRPDPVAREAGLADVTSGFVRTTPTDIVWPDYTGNSMFNTLGNLHAHPRAGLTFLDFTSGTVLQATGEATVEWNPPTSSGVGGAERLIHVELTRVVELQGVFAGSQS